MAINKKLIHFNNKSAFNTLKVSANSANTSYKIGGVGSTTSGAPDIKYQSIVFIKDTLEIWTHDKFYPCPFTKSELLNLLNGKVNKVTGKGLSTNDFDNTYKEILDYYDRSKGRYLECSGNARPATTNSVTLGNVYTGPLDNLTTEEIYIDAATTEKAGVMSSSDKKYLDNIKGLGVIGTVGLGVSTDASTVYIDYDGISPTGSNINGGAIHIPAATTTDAGCMTSADKQDLNNIKSTINNLSTTYLPLSGGLMNENATIGFTGTNNLANYNINGVSLTNDNNNRCEVSSNIIRVSNTNNGGITNITPASIYIGNSESEVSTTLSDGNIKIENSATKSYSNITSNNITTSKVISNSADIKTINSTTSITTPTLTTTREIVCGNASEDNVNITQEGVAVNDYSNTGNYSVMGAGYILLYEDTGGIDVTLTASDLQKLLALIK